MKNPFLIIVISFLILFTGCDSEGPKWKYSPFSKAVIQFNIINDPPIPYYVNTASNTLIPRDYYESDPTKIEQSGKYNHSVEIDRPSIVRTNFGEQKFNVFVFPGDTTYMNIEFIKGGYDITFTGEAKAINTYYLEKKLEFKILESYQHYPFRPKTPSEITKVKHKIDSFTNTQLSFLNNCKPIQKISKRFIQFEQSEIIYKGISDKMYELNSWFKLDNTDDYFDFLDSVEIDNHEAIFSPTYLRFLDNYFELTEKIEFNERLSRGDAVQDLAKKRINISNKLLTENTRYVYNLYNFCRIIPYHTDKGYIDSLAVACQIKNYQPFLRLMGTRDEKGYDVEKLLPGKSISEFYVSDQNYALVSIRDFQDYIVLLRFYTKQNESLKTSSLVLSTIENMYRENKNLQLLNICIDCETQIWLDSASKSSSRIINLIAEGNWNRSLKRNYQLTGDQKYVLLNQDNLYVQMFETIPGNIQYIIDSILLNSKYHEIEIR